MNVKSLRTGVAAAVGGAVLVGGLLLGASIATAQNSDSSQLNDSTRTTVPEQSSDGGEGLMHRDGCQFFQDLADRLGIDLDQLQQQIEGGSNLQQLLKDAGIDPESLPRRPGNGPMSDFGNGSGPGALPFLGHFGNWFGDLNLGIDLGGLRDRLESGMTLEEALTDMGVDVDSAVAQAKQAARDRIDQLLTDGRITSERADELKQMVDEFDLSQGFPFGLDRPGVGRSDDGSHLRGPGRGFRFFDNRRDDGSGSGTDGSSAAGVLLNV
jgi:hypothetical protein